MAHSGNSPQVLNRKQYEKELARLQEELARLQEWIVHAGLRVAVLFEGRDTAGKGGVIKRISHPLRVDPLGVGGGGEGRVAAAPGARLRAPARRHADLRPDPLPGRVAVLRGSPSQWPA